MVTKDYTGKVQNMRTVRHLIRPIRTQLGSNYPYMSTYTPVIISSENKFIYTKHAHV